MRGAVYWTSWVVAGAVALTFVAFFVVPPFKGEASPALGFLVNGAWGFGTALLLRFPGAVRS